jgi:hypothetical protein
VADRYRTLHTIVHDVLYSYTPSATHAAPGCERRFAGLRRAGSVEIRSEPILASQWGTGILLLTNSVGQGSTSPEIPRFLFNPKIRYHVHKISQIDHVLSQTNPVHIIPLYIFKISFNIIHLTNKHYLRKIQSCTSASKLWIHS